jgi:hypothetical protein
MARLALLETDPSSAVTRLHLLVRQREALRDAFRPAWDVLARHLDAADQEAWSDAALALVHVNAGAECLKACWTASAAIAEAGGNGRALAEGLHAGADVCRHAGAAAARLCFDAWPQAHRLADGAPGPWWRALLLLAQRGRESLPHAVGLTRRILEEGGPGLFATFVAAGLKHGGGDKARRQGFFSLEDPAALRVLAQAGEGLANEERRLRLFGRALWGFAPSLRGIDPVPGQPPPRRVSLAGRLIRMPHSWPGIPAAQAPRLYRAALAHATAHLAFGGPRFAVGQLKPLQLALIGLVEDARVEGLAMRRYPGLRRLWAPFHVAQASSASATAPALMARLARALFDPGFEDPDGWVAKGVALFHAQGEGLEDPALSRRIGGLLGNDLGQMRVQFNARTYVVEPAYRDDGLGLWDHPDPPDTPPEEIEMAVEAARIERREEDREDARADHTQPPNAERRGKARQRDADARGHMVATYPEWDRAAGVLRPDWTSVREVAPRLGEPRLIEALMERESALLGRVNRLVRSARIGRATRLRRQAEGHDFDLDALIEAGVMMRAGIMPDDKVHRSSAPLERDIAVAVLIDVSMSTADRIEPDGPSILDVERTAVAVLAEAMAALGERFCLMAFSSDGREDVRVTTVKGIGEAYGPACKARLVGLTPDASTRLGAALRHAGAALAPIRSHRKLVIALTDGEPSDVDVPDPADLVEDARRAVLELRGQGIDAFGVTLDPQGVGSGPVVFGRANHMPARRLEDLPRRLSDLYFRLARR